MAGAVGSPADAAEQPDGRPRMPSWAAVEPLHQADALVFTVHYRAVHTARVKIFASTCATVSERSAVAAATPSHHLP